MGLSRRAQAFQDFLHERGLDLTVIELPDSTRTAEDAARGVDCNKAQIVKSLIFRTIATAEPVLVLASGANRVNEAAIARFNGGAVGKADADFVRETTGYAIGGVPPLGHKRPLATFVDEDLLQFDQIWAAAGTPNAMFRISGKITGILPPHRVVSVR